MNPNSPMSYYQLGAVTVTNGSKTVIGYKTEWKTSLLPSKPIIGSVFTIDQANFYVVEDIVDDNTITLNKEYIGPNNSKSSYLLINQLDVDFTEDDRITAEAIIKAAAASAKKAEEWAIKMDGPVEGEEYSSKHNASVSKDWSVKMDGPVEDTDYSAKYNADLSKGYADQSKDHADEAAATAKELADMKTKLDSIEEGATADQVASEVPVNQDAVAELPKDVQAALEYLFNKIGSGGGLPEGDLDLKNFKILNLKAGSADGDAVNHKQLSDLEKKVDDIDTHDDQTALEVPANQDTHADLPANVQAALDALWGRPSGGGGSDPAPLGSYLLLDNVETTPTEYLYCGGAAISRDTYSDLFAKIGTKYGYGDGSTTFNLPTQQSMPTAPYGVRVNHNFNEGEKVAGIAVNSRTKDIYVIGQGATSSGWDVYKQSGGVGPWVSQGYDVGRQPLDIAVNESNGDLWVADSFLSTYVYKKEGGSSTWVDQGYSSDGGKYAFSIAVNQSNGDVWVTDQNAVEVFKLPHDSSTWSEQGYNVANDGDRIVPTGIDIDYSTGDIYVSDKDLGRISIKRGGVGNWEEEDTGKIDSAAVYIAVNPSTKDIFLMRNAGAILYLKKNGVGDLITVQNSDSNLNSPGLAIDYLNGDIYFSGKVSLPKAAAVYRIHGVPQWFIKATSK